MDLNQPAFFCLFPLMLLYADPPPRHSHGLDEGERCLKPWRGLDWLPGTDEGGELEGQSERTR